MTETDITSPKLALASEVTAINVDQLDIVPSILRNRRKTSDNGEPKKTKETEKDIAAKEAASSQIPETDITSPKLALASEVTAINVDQLDIVPSIAKETDEKPVITVEPKGEKKDSKKIKKKSKKRTKSKKTKKTEKDIALKKQRLLKSETDITSPNWRWLIKKKSKKRTKSKKTKKTEKDIAAKEAASSQVTETDITSPKLHWLVKYSDDVDQRHCSTIQRNSEKPVIRMNRKLRNRRKTSDNGEPKGEKKDSKKIKKKSKKRTKSKKTKKTEKDIAAKEAASSQMTETDITSPKLALASEVTAINVDQLDIVPSILKKQTKNHEVTAINVDQLDIVPSILRNRRKTSDNGEPKETDITSPNLALASEVTAINVDQLDIVPSIPEETDEKPVITDEPKEEVKEADEIKENQETEKDIAAKEAASSQDRNGYYITETALASEVTAINVDQLDIVPSIAKKQTKNQSSVFSNPETDITSPKLALASEVTAINVDQLDIVPSIAKKQTKNHDKCRSAGHCSINTEETDEKPVITDEPKGEKKDSKKIKKKSKKRTKSKKTKKTEKDIAAKEAASSQMTETDNTSPKLRWLVKNRRKTSDNGEPKETDITSPNLALASEVTAINVDQLDIAPSIPEETDEKPVITIYRKDEPKGEKKDSKKIKKKSKKRTKSKKTKKTEKDIAAKEAASSQETETDITSRKLALASEVTAINVDQLDIVPSIAKETDEKPVITGEPKAAKEAASSQDRNGYYITKLALASEVTAINVDQLDIVKSIAKETDEKPVITVEPKAEKKDSKKIKKKSKKRTKSKKTKETEKDIAAKEAASSQIPETDITSRKLALASEVTAINVDQLDIVPSIAKETDEKPVITGEPKGEKKDSKKIKKKSKKRSKSKKTKRTEKDIAAKEAASSQVTETDITSPNLALASEVTAINVDQLDIAPSIPEETDEKPVITIYRKKTKKTEKDIAAKEAASSQMTETDNKSSKFTLASEVTAVDVDQQNIVPTIPEETVEKPLLKDEPKVEKKDSKKIKKKSKKRTKSKKTKKTDKVKAPKKQHLLTSAEHCSTNPEETAEKPVITGEPKGEKKDSKKIKKKSKKRTKSKKSKKAVEDTAAKEAASSQVTETDNKSPKFTLASEVTAVDVEQPVIVPRTAEDAVKKLVINDEPKGEKKDSKKIKKRSKKRSKSKKSNKSVEDKVAK
ncbi:Zonadhesin [Trichinella spiralis]|uniref:Zonadhesin n=2 Tax=Trichinella spiralis TaxID=6334 RepID=A0ABR3L1W0_TRISP